ncbi:hypothetical protein LZ30DRAFT_214959 [Colletotrichum cereale]|nr:hypothetical protein LZ30DRAFT_214959 [Colletotrichum cereale]
MQPRSAPVIPVERKEKQPHYGMTSSAPPKTTPVLSTSVLYARKGRGVGPQDIQPTPCVMAYAAPAAPQLPREAIVSLAAHQSSSPLAVPDVCLQLHPKRKPNFYCQVLRANTVGTAILAFSRSGLPMLVLSSSPAQVRSTTPRFRKPNLNLEGGPDRRLPRTSRLSFLLRLSPCDDPTARRGAIAAVQSLFAASHTLVPQKHLLPVWTSRVGSSASTLWPPSSAPPLSCDIKP